MADGAECIRFSKQLAVLAYLMSRPQAHANIAGRAPWTLVISGRSVGTLALVDDVKVWAGVVLDPVQPARPSGRRVLHGRTR